MQNLYNQLTNPIIEYNDKGEQIQRPPLPVMLRSARALQQIEGINITNNALIQQQALQISNLEQLLKEANEGLHEARRQIELLGRSGSDTSGSDTNGEAGIHAEGHDPGTD